MSGSNLCGEYTYCCDDCLLRLYDALRACSYIHGGLVDRAIIDFAVFILAMHDYLMHGKIVENDIHITPFQKMIIRELYDPKDICDYVRLFEFYCQWLHLWTGLSMKLMEVLGLEKFAKLIGIEIPKKEKKEEVKEASA